MARIARHEIDVEREMARSLGTGRFSDFMIRCGPHSFHVHKLILVAKSTFFRGLITGDFSESSTSAVDLAEDNVGLVARLLIYMYTGNSYIAGFDSFPQRLGNDIFNNVPDKYELAAGAGWAEKAILHAKMYTIADKFGVPGLDTINLRAFIRLIYDANEPQTRKDFLQDGRDWENTCYTSELAEANNKVIDIVYSEPCPQVLQMIVLGVVLGALQYGNAYQSQALLQKIKSWPQLAYDLAVHQLSARDSTCSECGCTSTVLRPECVCGNINGCPKAECKQIWQKTSYCPWCDALGTMSYPEEKEGAVDGTDAPRANENGREPDGV